MKPTLEGIFTQAGLDPYEDETAAQMVSMIKAYVASEGIALLEELKAKATKWSNELPDYRLVELRHIDATIERLKKEASNGR